MQPAATAAGTTQATKWAKVIDHTKCIGCHACTTACKSENQVPLSVNRTYVKYVDAGRFPDARRAFQVTRCNQCEDAPCTEACPTGAMYQRPDGIVDFDKSICIGCKACIAACPYDAIFMNPEDHSAEKCNFCAHRLDVGLEPSCVVVCPTEAILVGDLNDPTSRVARIVGREAVSVRRPEKQTRPKLFYVGAHQAALDPLAARVPDGGIFMWSEQNDGRRTPLSRAPAGANTSAAALLSYDVPHRAPWDWRVSLYTWTKSIAAGAYLVPAVLGVVMTGSIDPSGFLWRWAAPVLASVFLAITGLLLIWDLEHPARFFLIFTRPRFGSWLVRGAFIIAAYAAVLGLHLAASVLNAPAFQSGLAALGIPLAALTAVYTAYLFAQAKARDLWQSPLLPPHLLIQALLAGSAVLALLAAALAPDAVPVTLWVVGLASLIHVGFVLGEVSLTHATAHASRAARELTRGAYRIYFWTGLLLASVAVFSATWGPVAALAGLLGLLLHEHAYVQAGQSVPLA